MPSPTRSSKPKTKFTRGDKCILIHIAVTLLILLVLIVIYVVHIIVVKHEGMEALRITRRTLGQPSRYGAVDSPLEVPDYSSIGVVYIKSSPPRAVCSSILVNPQWSLVPAHCVTVRSEPELAMMLPNWRIRYGSTQFNESDIKGGIVHSYYNKDDFDNNIGLFEHMKYILLPEFIFPEKVVSDLLKANSKDLVIVGWDKVDGVLSSPVHLLMPEKCSQYVSPIVDAPRKSEVCVVQNRDDINIAGGVHGAALFLESQIVGFFSWGDREGRAPQVVLVIAPYRSWLENMIAMRAKI